MPAKIVWRHQARSDLIALLGELADKNPQAALQYVDDIETKVGQLADFPELAPSYNETYRMLVVRKHLVFYRFDRESDTVFVTSVIYGGRDLETLLGPR